MVVPFYNPGGPAVHDTVAGTVAALSGAGISFEVLAVSDGSTDGSASALEPLLSDSVRVITLAQNRGKGHAVKVGLTRGRGRYLGFIDGDGDISPDHLVEFLNIAREHESSFVVGSKRHPESHVSYPRMRWFYSWSYQRLVRLLFKLKVQDTQVGIKLIRRDVAMDVLPMMVEDRYAFDLEMLLLARQLGYVDVREAAVRIRAREGSTISVRAVASMIGDTAAIFWRLRVHRRYGLGSSRPPVEVKEISAYVAESA